MADRSDENALAGRLHDLGYEQQLKRSLGLVDLIVYGLVFMVPIAPFAIFGVVFNASEGMVPLTYVIGLIAMLFTALSYRTMSAAFPVAGSVYTYAGRGINDSVGFVAGWGVLLDYLLIPTLLYVTGAAALAAVVPAVPQWLWVVIFVVGNTTINYLGIDFTARANRVFLVAELVILAIFLAAGLFAIVNGTNGAHFDTTPFWNPHVVSPGLIFGALSIAALSFLGFDGISTLSEEVRGGPRTVGRATLVSLVLVALLFIVQTYVAALLVPKKHAFSGQTAINTAFYDVAGLAAGHWLTIVVAVASALSAAVANSLVAQAATARLLFSMARDGKLPRQLAHVHARRRVPARATLLVGGISLVLGLCLVGQVELLSSLVNFGALVGFLLLHLSVVVYFIIKRRDRRWVAHLVAPVIGFVIIAYVLYNAATPAKIGGISWLAVGCVVLLVLKRTGRSTSVPLE